ncbi:MAG: DMT family transporter [Acidimicrobiia bacterium]|nr:DMT family transporter [bacterium]MXW69659.1 DMT family transporter [Acidimicrobiia bacterium]MXX00684.1 DMT family transporter [Acidimicrobiia bacterium]MXY73627.1 DMT family transporter [Acidimicrobiia bacterium]MYA40139.1 DMT family transporter [Acidimicrobiia bacterium]
MPVTDQPTAPPTSRVLPYFCLGWVVLGLGFNWPILDVGVASMPPLWLMTFRLLGGALVGFGMNAMVRRRAFIHRRDRRIVTVLGIFRLFAIFIFVFYALRILPPGRSAILVWTSTLWTVPIASIFLGERMSRLQTSGLVIGMLGMGVVVEPWELSFSEPRVIWGYLLITGAALSAAWTSVYIRGHSWTASPLASTPWQMLAGGVPAVAAALAVEGMPDIQWTWAVWGVVTYQATVAGPIVVWAHLTALRHIPVVPVNLTLMATPVVGLLASWWWAEEIITLTLVGGLVMIAAGVSANIFGDDHLRPHRSGMT